MKSMTIRFNDDAAEELGIFAKAQESPVADVIRKAVEEYIWQHRTDPTVQEALRKRIAHHQAMLSPRPEFVQDLSAYENGETTK